MIVSAYHGGPGGSGRGKSAPTKRKTGVRLVQSHEKNDLKPFCDERKAKGRTHIDATEAGVRTGLGSSPEGHSLTWQMCPQQKHRIIINVSQHHLEQLERLFYHLDSQLCTSHLYYVKMQLK